MDNGVLLGAVFVVTVVVTLIHGLTSPQAVGEWTGTPVRRLPQREPAGYPPPGWRPSPGPLARSAPWPGHFTLALAGRCSSRTQSAELHRDTGARLADNHAEHGAIRD